MGENVKDTGILIPETATQVTVYSYGTSPADLTFNSLAKRNYMVGQTLPRFRDRVARGELLPHTRFTQSKWEGRYEGGSFFSRNKSNGRTVTITNWAGLNNLPFNYRIFELVDNDCEVFAPSPPDDYYQSLLQKASARIYAQGWDALTSSAEANKLVDLFRTVGKHVINFKHHGLQSLYRNKRWGKDYNKFDPSAIADLWLTSRYGIRPIVYDLQDMHHALTEFEERREVWSERVGITIKDSDSVYHYEGDKIGNLTYDMTSTHEASHSLRGSVTGRFKPTRVITNPVKTAWELVPFSFVVDWVVDVGSYLDSLMFRAFSPEWSASVGNQTTWSRDFSIIGTNNSSYDGSAYADWHYEGVVQRRAPSNISNLPQVTYNPFNAWQLGDIVALLRQTGKYH